MNRQSLRGSADGTNVDAQRVPIGEKQGKDRLTCQLGRCGWETLRSGREKASQGMSLRRQRGSCTEGGGQQGPSQKGGEKTDGVGEPSQTWIPSKRPSGTPEVGSQWFICQNTMCSLVISSGQNPRGNLHWPHCPGALCSQGVWSACPTHHGH